MQIINSTKKKILSDNASIPRSLVDNIVGLIGKDQNSSMIFNSRFGIHTFGMRFPIDVLVLNNKKIVVSIKKDLKPFRIFFWNPIHKVLIELPAGTIKISKTELGDIIKLTAHT